MTENDPFTSENGVFIEAIRSENPLESSVFPEPSFSAFAKFAPMKRLLRVSEVNLLPAEFALRCRFRRERVLIFGKYLRGLKKTCWRIRKSNRHATALSGNAQPAQLLYDAILVPALLMSLRFAAMLYLFQVPAAGGVAERALFAIEFSLFREDLPWETSGSPS